MTILFTLILSVSVSAAPGTVKGLKKSNKYSTYKGWVSKTKMKKIKYRLGYKISWKKVKKASGYEVYAYMVGSKKWMKVKTTKKNYYVLTNILSNNKLKIKVRAYKNKSGVKEYGKFSKKLSIKKTKGCQKIYNNSISKSFKDRYSGENAFVLQNDIRKKAGSNKLVWSEELYNICVMRLKDLEEEFSHDKKESTAMAYLKKNYGIDDIWYDMDNQTDDDEMIEGVMLVGGENIAIGQTNCKEAISSWKGSKGHYLNMINSSYKSGAIACYSTDTATYWVALFSRVDLDAVLKTEYLKR